MGLGCWAKAYRRLRLLMDIKTLRLFTNNSITNFQYQSISYSFSATLPKSYPSQARSSTHKPHQVSSSRSKLRTNLFLGSFFFHKPIIWIHAAMKNLTVLLAIVAVFVKAQQIDSRCYSERMLIESGDKMQCNDHSIYNICDRAAHIDQPAAGHWVNTFRFGYYPEYGCFRTEARQYVDGGCNMRCTRRGGCVCDAI
ncbi:MAG: hypothetical protein J3R72DRAFT_508517 [Linnemannia gamsii]|nr:MAG: hypothetical protein J3R72DRAFT_508517 [Linnemannia gamsii]